MHTHLKRLSTRMNEEVKYPCWQYDQLFLRKENLLNTKGYYKKESNTLVGNAANNFLRREFLLNTKGQCGQHFFQNGNFANKHKRALHEGVNYPCWQCGQKFSQKWSLVEHAHIYEGVKYPCGQCGQQFSQKGILAEYKRELREGVKYPCGLCGQQLSQNGNLT